MTSGLEEPVQFRIRLLWPLLRRVMSARQRAELDNIPGVLPPRGARVEHLLGMTLCPPDDQHRTLNLVPCLEIGAVHLEVKRRASAVVFADRMEILWRTATRVLRQRLRAEAALANAHG